MPAATAEKIQGTAHDNLAIWLVRWRDNLGGRGVAELDFKITEGDMLYIKDWRMDWSVPREALTDGASSVTVRAVDIKRNTSAPVVVALDGAGAVDADPGAASMRLTGVPPRRLVVPRRLARVEFSFAGGGDAVAFQCRLDGRASRECGLSSIAYRVRAKRRWTRHRFAVVAVDPGGNRQRRVDWRFRIRRR